MNYKIIDFHTHPFLTSDQNICNYKNYIEGFDKDFFTVKNKKSKEKQHKIAVFIVDLKCVIY